VQAKVKTIVKSRTDAQCRERYVNCLAPSINRDKFHEQEDELLEESVAVRICRAVPVPVPVPVLVLVPVVVAVLVVL
jgi:hypothetical protein